MQRYRTPKGVDEREVDYPATYTNVEVGALKSLGIKFTSWKGVSIAVGPGFTTEWFDEVSERLRDKKSVIIVITGQPGEGKSWAGLRICEIFDKKFDADKQVCFKREKLARIISGGIKLKAGQAILIDEAHMATGARHWAEEMQKEVVDQVAAIRSRGFLVIIVVLHISMIDKILRKFVLTYHICLEERGISVVYKFSMSRFEDKIYRQRLATLVLSVPGADECLSPKCLDCDYLNRDDSLKCMNIRAVYERDKARFLKETSLGTIEKMRSKSEKALSTDEKIAIILKNKSMLHYTTSGKIHFASVQDIFESLGKPIGVTQANMLAQRAQWKHPELVQST